jgi:hypothetical protein
MTWDGPKFVAGGNVSTPLPMEPRSLWLEGNESGPVYVKDGDTTAALAECSKRLLDNQFIGGTSRYAAVQDEV